MDIYELLFYFDNILAIFTIGFMWVRRKNLVQSGVVLLIVFGIITLQFLFHGSSSRALNFELWALLLAWGCMRLYMYAVHNEETEDEESEEGEPELPNEIKEQAEKAYMQNERGFLMHGQSRLLDVVHISELGESFLVVGVEMDSSQEGGSPSKVQKQCVLRYTQNASSEDEFEIAGQYMRDNILEIYNNVNCTQCLIKGRLSEQIKGDGDYICRHLD